MTCNRFRTLIQQRFDQDLTTQDHRALINHLEGCESCAKFDHQLDQMIQAAQDTPAPDEVRPQNPEALARLIMEQLPQKKGSLINMIMGIFGGGGSPGGKPKSQKAPKAPKEQKATAALKGGSSAIKDKAPKGKGGKPKEKFAPGDLEEDRRPGGVTFGRKKEEGVDADAIESQVGTFSRLKSISSNRTPEQLDRDAQSTTRSLGEKFGMPGANTILEEGPLTLAESIKRKVSESQRMSPLDDDPDASGSLMQAQDNTGGSAFGRSDSMGGGGAASGGNWGPPAFAGQPKPMGQTAGDGDKGDWGAPGGMKPAPGQTFPAPGPVGLDEHPGSSIGLAPPGSKRPMTSEQPAESTKAGIGLSAPAPGGGMDWGTPKTPTAGGAGGWGSTDSAKTAPAAAGGQSGWTSGWGGEGDGQAPLKSSDSWAVPGSESTNSWGQPSDAPAGGFSNPAGAPGGAAAAPAPAQASPASPTDPWAPPAGTWGAGQAAADAANASQGKSNGDEAWGAAANAHATAPATDPWGTAPAPNIKIEAQPQAAAPAASDAWGSAPTPAAPVQNEAWGAAAAASPAPAQSDAWGATAAPAPAPTQADAWGNAPAAPAPAQAEAWGAAPEAAPAQADAWGAAPAAAPAQPDAWGAAPAASPAQPDAWGAAPATAAAPAQADAWGAAATAAPAQADAWGAAPSAAPAQADAWGAPAAAPAQADAWGAAPAAAPAQADAWGAAPAAAPAQADAWGAAPAAAPAPAQADAWGSQPAAPAAQNSAWGAAAAAPQATPSPAPAAVQADAWGSAPAAPASDGWGGAAPQPSWGGAPNAASADAAPAASDWGAAPAVIAAPAPVVGEPVNGLAAQYSTIPPGQFATPANAGTAIASSGWGQAPVAPEPLDAAQIEAKKNAWAQEAEQLETGTWRAFAPKMNEGLGSTPPPLPSPGPAPAMQPPQAAGGDRWDLPIQERAKSQTDMPVQPSEAAPPVMPIQPVAAQTAAQQRWDVPIQERAKMEAEAPQAAPAMPSMGMPSMGMPPGAVGSPVGASGIPVNQIVEKMGQVLGGTSQAASAEAQESRWDVPIQERMKSQSSQEVPVVPSVAPAPQAPAWGQPASFDAPQPQAPAPVAPAADNSWGTSASSWGQEPAAAPAIASGWDNQPAAAQAAASGWDAQPAAAPAVASGWDAQPAAAPAVASGWDMQPAAAPSNGGWGSGDAIPQPAAQPTSSWGQPAGSSWGEAPAAAAVGQPAQSAAPAGQSSWGNDTAAGGWGQPPAPMANSWATPPAQTPAGAAPPPPPPPPPEPPAIKPEITDKVQGGGLLTGIDDKAIDRIFGEIGVQEPVSKGLVNSGGEPVSNFSPPATPAPEPMAAAAPSPPVPAQAFAQPSSFPQAASAAPEAPKGLLGGIDDNAIDRIFSQNLGVSEPSVPVGRGAEMATAGAVSNNWASAAPAAVPAPQAPAAVEPAGGSGWGAPPAATGWGQPAIGQAPPAEAPAAAGNSGWGMAPTAAPSQWGQPPQAAESGPPKLFSVDDMAMDKIFENNLGIKDGQQAANAPAMSAAAQMPPPAPFAAPLPTAADMPAPEAAYQGGPPPKIEGIGRLDAGGDQNQDAGSGRIASIGKFLLDQKDLDKIGKLTNTDFNDSKLRILTKENSDDLQALLGQIGTQKGVVGSVIVGHDGLLIANTMPSDMDAESVGVWALGVYMNTEHVTKKMGHDRVHQVVSRTPRGYVIIADFGGGLLVTVTEGKDTDSLIPLMRTITQLVN